MKCPQFNLLKKAFCLSEQTMHYNSSIFISNFLHSMIFHRVFLLKQQGKVPARKLYSLLDAFNLVRMRPSQLSIFFLPLRSSHSRHFFSPPNLQMKLCRMCRPNLKQNSQRVTSSQSTHLYTVQLAQISLSWHPSQQQLYSLPTFLLIICSLCSTSFCRISLMISGGFQSLQSGHLTIPLLFISCLAHCAKHQRWKVFMQTVVQVVTASHFTICIWQIAQRLSSSSSSSSSSMITFLRERLILTYFRKSETLLSWMRRLAMMYLSSLSVQVGLKRRGWSLGRQKISRSAWRVCMQCWEVVLQEHFSQLPMVILNFIPLVFSRIKLVRPVMPTRQNFQSLAMRDLVWMLWSYCCFLAFAFDIKYNIISPISPGLVYCKHHEQHHRAGLSLHLLMDEEGGVVLKKDVFSQGLYQFKNMLIKNIELVDHVRQAKHKLYSITKILNLSFESVNPIYLLIIHVLIAFPFISILFTSQDIFPSSVSSVLRVFLLSNLISSFGISVTIVTIAVLVFAFMITVLTILHFVFTSIFGFCSKLLSFLTKLTEYFIVPLINFSAYCIVQIGNGANPGLQSMYALTIVFVNFSALVVLVLLKFQIKMLRKKNTVWNLDNDIHVYALLYIIFKTYFISFNGTTISICFLSLAAWYFLLSMDSGCINPMQRRIERSTYYAIAATDFAALISLITQNPLFGLYLWILVFGSVIVYIFIEYFIKKKERIFIPPCESQPCQFYNFYYNFKEEFKTDEINTGNKKNYKNIFNLHRIHCQKQCLLNFSNAKENDEAIEEQITQLITFRKNQNIDNRLIYELWNLELGHKCQVECLVDKPLTFKQDFILYSIEKLTKDSEATIKSSESNKNVISKVFYDLIYEISSHYSLFYEQLARTHPKIDSIVSLGISIRKKVEKLKEIYSQLLKTRLINFKMIELYLEFFTNFVNQNVMDKESVNRLMKVQQHMHFQDIAENYLPTFTIYPDTGNLENANSQAQKFLQCTRFELKYRNISDILYPSLTIQQLKSTLVKNQSEIQDQPMYTFLKKSQNDYTCGKITIQERYIKQKKLFILQIIKEPYSNLKNMFLLGENFQIELMLHKTSKIKLGQFRKDPIQIDWAQLFQSYIADQKDKLIKTKMAKVQTDHKGCLIIVKKLNSASSTKHLLLAQIIVSNENKDRKESVLQNRRSFQARRQDSKFQFHYAEDQSHADRLLIHGYREPNQHKISSRSKTLEALQRQNQTGQTGFYKIQSYAKDIKTYRLFDGDLYNIDLEDKEGYNDLFEEHVNQSKKKQVNEQSSLECYIFLAVILLGLTLISFSVVLIVKFQTDSNSISEEFTRYQSIEQFNIDFQRILSILRDQYSGLTAKFSTFQPNSAINQSYSRIQGLKNTSIFDNTQYSMQFQNLTMIGTLSELVDVILAHVTEVMYTSDLSIINDIQVTCVNQLNQMITSNQEAILSVIDSNITDITFLKNVLLYSSVAIILLLYFFMITYCIKSNYKAKEKLTDLMYISDSEARMLQDNAEKMKYAVEMARKNFDVDTQNLLMSVTEVKKRKNPKEAILSREIVYTIGAFTVIGLIIHLTCLFFFSQQFVSQVNNFSTMKTQGIAIESLYSQSCQLANYIALTNQINTQQLSDIRNQLNYVQHQIDSLLFSTSLNSFISTLFFDNSCNNLASLYSVNTSTCSNTCPGFTIINPFQIGVALYFHRQNYYVSNNITQNFAHTGIFSQYFARIFTNITQQIQKEGSSSLQNTFTIVLLLNGFIILIDCCYIFAFMIIYNYFREQFVKIKEILYFFSNKWKGKRGGEGVDQEVSQNSESGSEEENVADGPHLRQRKTTIDKNVIVQ